MNPSGADYSSESKAFGQFTALLRRCRTRCAGYGLGRSILFKVDQVQLYKRSGRSLAATTSSQQRNSASGGTPGATAGICGYQQSG
jgi:hypothetical protein